MIPAQYPTRACQSASNVFQSARASLHAFSKVFSIQIPDASAAEAVHAERPITTSV
jgi:hypothetical protein